MKPVFADTSYLVALASRNDAYHDAAMAVTATLLGRIVTKIGDLN